MKHLTILALTLILGACAPTYISVSGSIPPDIQQNISPAVSDAVTYNFIDPLVPHKMSISIAPTWDIELNPINPLKSAMRELIQNKFARINRNADNAIVISVPKFTYNVSRSGKNPSALSVNMTVAAIIRNGDKVYQRSFRHSATVATIGLNTTFFLRTEVAMSNMILAFVIDLDKFIQTTKI